MSSFYTRLEQLNITLPVATAPAAAYLPAVRSGPYLYLSGHLARRDGKPLVGRLGETLTTREGQAAARLVAIDLIATLHAATQQNLGMVQRIVKLTSLVASTPDFTEQHLVTNGCSELLAEVFGEAGRHARSAVGVAQLPLGACLEIELIAQLG